MNIRYLYNCNNSVFEVIGGKTIDNIRCTTLLINPLCRFITNKDDVKLLDNSIARYIEVLNSIHIQENDDIVENESYFLFGSIDNADNNISFAHSDIFKLSNEDFETVQNKSIELTKTITSIINNNKEDIENNLEIEITNMLRYNLAPLEDGVAEVFGIVLIPQEDNIPNFTVKYYSDPNNQNSNINDLINNMFDTIVPEIVTDLKPYNFFMIKESISIIKLGLSTNGEYIMSTNNTLVNPLSNDKADFVKNVLVETYEAL